MIRKFIFSLCLLSIFPVYYTAAQTPSVNVSATMDASRFPQWAKDMRRWEIVAFGAFPFAMFTATFGMDTYRFADAGWNDTRYAPWPFKSAGAVDMTNREYETTMIIAASLSVAVAFADLIIVQAKRHKERRFAESLPVGTKIIIRQPWPIGAEADAESDSDTQP